jgi:3',5'-cyclic AMP phosphodiesterase CpdA
MSMRLLVSARWLVVGSVVALACGESTSGAEDPGGMGGGPKAGSGGAPSSGSGGAGGLASAAGAGGTAGRAASGGVGGTGGTESAGGAEAAGGTGPNGAVHQLWSPPFLFAPTAKGFSVSVILTAGDPATLFARVRLLGTEAWSELTAPIRSEADRAEWDIEGLEPGSRYEYLIVETDTEEELTLGVGIATTARQPGSSFSFAMVSDTHIGADLAFSNQGDEVTLSGISREIATASPDLVVNLGDILDFHEYGFVEPPPDASITRNAYRNYRATFGSTLSYAAHYGVLGGWDSENGCDTPEEIDRSRQERLRYMPGPKPETYLEGGSPFEDYYAFTWGDALFVMLNVFTYTPGCHQLSTYPGLRDDWTLGDAQLAWLRSTLEGATAKWKFLMIHHPVGGDAGNPELDPVNAEVNSAYGRGGGRAARVGEQEIVHELMREFGVQAFFYGHDHVFTDMTVDDIHYSLPGSAGAIWFFTEAETGYSEFWSTSGWAKVDVTPNNVHVQFLALGGELLYEYTLD